MDVVLSITTCGLAVLALVTGLQRLHHGDDTPQVRNLRRWGAISAVRATAEILAAAGLWVPLVTRTAHDLIPVSAALLLALATADVVRHISHPEPEGLHAPSVAGALALTVLGLHGVGAAT